MKIALLGIVTAVLVSSLAPANDLVYQGTWNTTNRKLDGVMTCVVTHDAKEELTAHFQGTWQGAPIDYRVRFTGPAAHLRGTATIDGARYECRGWITREQFRANFSGDRYAGSFDLKRTEPPQTARKK